MTIKKILLIFTSFIITVIAVVCAVGNTNVNHNNKITEDAVIDRNTVCDTEYLEADSIESMKYDMAEAFAMVESGKNPDAKNGNCVGYLQISPVCVKEVNRLLGDEYFLLSDRYDMWASVAMFVAIMDHKNPTYDLKKACEIWNPTAGEWYYKRVLNAYKKLRDED